MSYDEKADFEAHSQQITDFVGTMHRAKVDVAKTGDRSFFRRLATRFSGTKTTVLDVGAGQGMHACFLADYFDRVHSIDLIEYPSIYDGRFRTLLDEKYRRNGIDVEIGRLDFTYMNAHTLALADESVDCVVSFNALEHIPDPDRALREMIRVVRPGGHVFVTFDPLWTADTGGHFTHFVPEPWEHLLISEDEYVERMVRAGAQPGDVDDLRHGINKRRPAYFEQTLATVLETLPVELLLREQWSGTVREESQTHANFRACVGSGFSESELLLRGMRFVLRKKRAETRSGS